jgi:hypothetical protein
MSRLLKSFLGVAESGDEMLKLPTRREVSSTHRSPISSWERGWE